MQQAVQRQWGTGARIELLGRREKIKSVSGWIFFRDSRTISYLEEPRHFTDETFVRGLATAIVAIRHEVITQQRSVHQSLDMGKPWII